MNQAVPGTTNPPVGEAAASRERQSTEHKKAIMRGEAAVWRRREAFNNAKNPRRKAKARRKLERAEFHLQQVRILGSLPTNQDLLAFQFMKRRRSIRAKLRPGSATELTP